MVLTEEQKVKDDLISRSALISTFLNRQRSETESKYHVIAGEDVLNMIQNAPAVNPDAEQEAET